MEDRTEHVRASGFTDFVAVCTTEREGDACCGTADGEATFEAVADWLRERDVFWSHVHVARASCLGLCSEAGVGVAVHPRGRFVAGVTPADVPALLSDVFGPDAECLGIPPES